MSRGARVVSQWLLPLSDTTALVGQLFVDSGLLPLHPDIEALTLRGTPRDASAVSTVGTVAVFGCRGAVIGSG